MKATTEPILINTELLDRLVAAFPASKRKFIRDTVIEFNDMVNKIESNPYPTTKDNYGVYLGLVKDKTTFILFKAAGAGKGANSAYGINTGNYDAIC